MILDRRYVISTADYIGLIAYTNQDLEELSAHRRADNSSNCMCGKNYGRHSIKG